MPVYAADVLPDATGRNLGNAWQRWNLYTQNLDVQGSIRYQPMPGATLTPTGVIYVETVPTTAALNTTATQMLSSCTVPGGTLDGIGKVLRATMSGGFTTQTGQAPWIIVACRLGGIQTFGVQSEGPLPTGVTGTWRAQWELTVLQGGNAAQITQSGILYYLAGGGFNALTVIDEGLSPSGPIDLSINQILQCECQFNSNTAPANVCTQRQFIVEVLN